MLQLYTLEEVAERLRIKPRKLGELLKDHPYYVRVGRQKLMEEADVRRLLEDLRWLNAHQDSKSTNRVSSRNRRSGTSVGHISVFEYSEALALARKRRLNDSSGSSNAKLKTDIISLDRLRGQRSRRRQ